MIHKAGDEVKVLNLRRLEIAMKKLTTEYHKDWAIYEFAGKKIKIKKVNEEDIPCSFVTDDYYYVLNDSKGTYAVDEFFEDLKVKLDTILDE